MRKTPARHAAAFAAALLAATGAAAAPDAPPLKGTAWVLSGLPGRPLLPGPAPTLRFDGGRAHGSDGCNRFASKYAASGAAIRFESNAAATQMACPEDVMNQASVFRGALLRASAWRIDGGRLELLDGAAVVATFAPQPAALAGTAWSVTGYNNGKQAVTSVLAGTTLDLAFTDGGRVGGTAGCNRFNGTYAASGNTLTFGPLATTRMACGEPEKIMEQEQRFLAALGTVATARFEGDRLELRRADGALAVSARRAAAPK